MIFDNSVCDADPRVAQAEGRRTACVFFDTRKPTRLI